MITARIFDRPGRSYIHTEKRILVNFLDANGDDVNPTTVTFKTCSPSAVEASYVYGTDSEITRTSTGHYVADIVPDESGRWHYRWETTGAGTIIKHEGSFLVQASQFYDDLDRGYS